MLLFLICLLIGICAVAAGWGFLDKRRMLQFPVLASIAVGLMIVPQLFALLPVADRLLPTDSLYKVIVMNILCLLMTFVGYYYSDRKPRMLVWDFNVKGLLVGCVVLIVVSRVAFILLAGLPEEQLASTQWTGLPVRYMFFAQAGVFAFALAVVVFAKYNSKLAAILLLPGLYDAARAMIVFGRRTPTAIFFLTVFCAYWFNKRKTVPRPVMIAGIAAFGVFVLSIGAYRDIMKSDDNKIERLSNMEIVTPLQGDSLVGGFAIEMENAANIMTAVDQSGKYDYGALLYNAIIFTYVPRQLVGSKVKNALMTASNYQQLTYDTLRYRMPLGTCGTGIAEAYFSFSYFGCLLFIIMGYVMRRLWEGAMTGNVIYQIMYMGILAAAVGVYNNGLANFITPWFRMVLFLGPIVIMSRAKDR